MYKNTYAYFFLFLFLFLQFHVIYKTGQQNNLERIRILYKNKMD